MALRAEDEPGAGFPAGSPGRYVGARRRRGSHAGLPRDRQIRPGI